MNKQELIEKYEKLEGVCKDPGAEIARLIFLEDLRGLDEPEKITIPQVAADWIKWTKAEGLDLQDAMNLISSEENEKLFRWFYHESNQETFARAWLDGFEIEKEKKYRVSMPKTRNYKNHEQTLCEKDSKIFWCGEWYKFKTKFTRKELEEAGFGWVFNCEGVEIEEVE